jgi:hypothetical protein
MNKQIKNSQDKGSFIIILKSYLTGNEDLQEHSNN